MGLLENSNARLYTKKVFNWTNRPPNILGVDLVHYDDSAAILRSFENTLEKIKIILNRWSNRNLSLSGKVLVVNSLIASLFVYKMSVLPNVPYVFIEQFQKVIAKYLAGNSHLRISLSMLELPKEKGGLRLVNLFKRQMALKAQWVVTIRDNHRWANIAYNKLDKLLKEDIWRCNLHIDDINMVIPENSFWKQVLYAWCLYHFHQPSGTPQILSQVLWLNSKIKIQNKVLHFTKAYDAGLIFVCNLFDEQGVLLQYAQICQKYGDCLSWFQHTQLIAALPHSWKESILRSHSTESDTLTLFDYLYGETKITSRVYTKLIEDSGSINKLCLKWQKRLNAVVESQELQYAFQAIVACTVSTKLRDFQFRLLQGLIVTNFNLMTWKKHTNNSCSFCKEVREHTVHLFVECLQVSKIWDLIQAWIQSKISNEDWFCLDWSPKSILFNLVHSTPSHVVNLIVLIVKQYIYRSRCLGNRLNFERCLNEIDQTKVIEYRLAQEKGKLKYHYMKWSKLYSEMQISDFEIQSQYAYVTNYNHNM